METKVRLAAQLPDKDGSERTKLVHASTDPSSNKNVTQRETETPTYQEAGTQTDSEAGTDQVFDIQTDEEENIYQASQPQNNVNDSADNMELTKRNSFQNFNNTEKYFHMLDNGDQIPLNLPNLTHLTDHQGILVTVLDTRYIFTQVSQNFAPILVTFEGAVFGKETIVRCRVIYLDDNSSMVLDKIEDGTKVKFDAVLQNSR